MPRYLGALEREQERPWTPRFVRLAGACGGDPAWAAYADPVRLDAVRARAEAIRQETTDARRRTAIGYALTVLRQSIANARRARGRGR